MSLFVVVLLMSIKFIMFRLMDLSCVKRYSHLISLPQPLDSAAELVNVVLLCLACISVKWNFSALGSHASRRLWDRFHFLIHYLV